MSNTLATLTHWLDPTSLMATLSEHPVALIVIIGFISLLESLAIVGLLVPGVVMLTAGASLAGHLELSLPLVLLSGALGAVIGDGVSFWLGVHHRDQLPQRWPFSRHPEWIEHGQRFFHRHGSWSIAFGRFVGPVRPIIPLVAGMLDMPASRFFMVNGLSALAWSPAYLLPGYLLGQTWQSLFTLPPGANGLLIGLASGLIACAFAFSFLRRQLGREGRLYHWLARRMRRSASGRRLWWQLRHPDPEGEFPLASMALLVFAVISVPAMSLAALAHPGPWQIDVVAASLADRLHTLLPENLLHQASLWLSQLGDGTGLAALVAPWLVWLALTRRHAIWIHLSAAWVGIACANTVLKYLIQRPRPDTPAFLEGSMSFPSAHTAGAVAVFGLAAAFIAERQPSPRRRWIYWSAIIACSVIGLSRIFLGVHYLSDILGGACLGLLACALVRISYPAFVQQPCPSPAAPVVWLSLASLGLLTARLLWLPL
ncbi:bifunctional DedA family/phosphatase PAP2 family protein [Cobetia marina]|jgi:undecaprenyl-diphosphatase|uniref:bifunctional DedA family/phosphatase PAP2 family protein n=1 Tax=Cobetia TaxID=204286 RepID=UPI001F0DF7D8|nr:MULTISPECIES: bifunctional DedA family/phosphatase PAP2 family protein [Cobetia]MDA5563731.1 bifunctional DedA family/phosphatase PAP2 family protein [Cobetia sp. MMG027]MDH2372502.1 bifunctional DedA family/phosphatase PAP2 family protein [Cobetia sp. 3AK]MDO6787692.1 bifunctional DedA family/phosphatase PAP2 family protein [Cobetia marina]